MITMSTKCIYFLSIVVSGAVEHGDHFTLNLVYEHILDRTSYSFTYGPFGDVKGRVYCIIKLELLRTIGIGRYMSSRALTTNLHMLVSMGEDGYKM